MSSKREHRAYQPIKPAASRMLAKKWDSKAYNDHRRKLRNIKPTVDTRPPKTYMHLQLKLKKLQMEEERLATVERDNRILLEKMSHIMRTRGRVDNVNDYKHKSLNKSKRQQELLRITHENQAILKRITAKQPFYDRSTWEHDFDKSMQLKSQIARYPTDSPRRQQKASEYHDDEDDGEESDDHDDHGSNSEDDDRASSRRSQRSQHDKVDEKQGNADVAADAESSKDDGTEDKPGFTREEVERLIAPGAAEKEALKMIGDTAFLNDLWKQCDYNGNGGCSLAEIDKMVVERGWKFSKPTLMRAYKKTTLQDGDGDPWVEKKEFASLIRNLFLFENLWEFFDDIDTGDDRRIDEAEFISACKSFASADQARKEFAKADKNGGGQILFKEFCDHLLEIVGVATESAQAKWVEEASKKSGKAAESAKQDFNGMDLDALRAAVAPGAAEKEALKMIGDTAFLNDLWKQCDYNGNGGCSLAEIDKMVVERGWKFSKPTLMRAYKKTTLQDGDGDPWVEKKEFASMISNLFLFENLWEVFDGLDAESDRRVDETEFTQGMAKLGCRLNPADAKAEFAKADKNGGGQILFKEFCDYVGGLLGFEMEKANAKWKEEASKSRKGSKDGSKDTASKRDSSADIDTTKFDAIESELVADLKSSDKVASSWAAIDFNGNGLVSLAEIDKWVVEKYPVLNSKPALMRAYKKTISGSGGDGDFVKKEQFPTLLRNIFYFNKLFVAFKGIDTDNDRRLDMAEFKRGLSFVGLSLDDSEAEKVFGEMDSNSGGVDLFDEFAAWAAAKKVPVS